MTDARTSLTLAQYLSNPKSLVDLLTDCSGDVELFAQQFGAGEHIGKITVLQAVLTVLGKMENAQHKLDWDDQIASWKDAKRLMAERKAFNWIGEYEPPSTKGKNAVSLTVAASFMRLWLPSHFESEKVTGRRKGTEMHVGQTERGAQKVADQMEEE